MARASTLNVSLTPTLRQYVQSKIEAGGYESASEVIRESLRTQQQHDRAQDEFWSKVRNKVSVARKQQAQGKVVDGESAMRKIIDELGDEPVSKTKQKVRSR